MSNGDLRSYQFRLEREEAWLELDRLLSLVEKGGMRRLDSDQLVRLPHLYRGTLSALSVARSISLDRGLVRYLEALSVRGFLAIYGNRTSFIASMRLFFAVQLPEAVRQSTWPILLSFLFMALGGFTGYWVVILDPERYFAVVPEMMAQGRYPGAEIETLRQSIYSTEGFETDSLALFASSLFGHNSMVGIFSFALGFALCVPTALLLFYNGLLMGGMVAAFDLNGLGLDFWGWLAIHGTTEIFALVLCGAGGMIIGMSIIFPGRYTRMDNLAANGQRAGMLIIGAIFMLLIAGLLEGFGRQLIQDMSTRFIIGGTLLVFWLSYFYWAGRK